MSEKVVELVGRAAMLVALWSVAVPMASAQIATITGVNVINGKNQVRVEVTLNAAVTPRIVTSREGRQIDLEFSRTVAELPVRLFSINSNGVERVWVTVDRTHAVSTVTVALLQKGQMAYSREGAKVILSLRPGTGGSEVAQSGKAVPQQSGAPAAAAGPWISLSRKQKELALPPSTSAPAISVSQGAGTGQQLPPPTVAARPGATSSSIYVPPPSSVTVSIGGSTPQQARNTNTAAATPNQTGAAPGFPAASQSNAPSGTQAANVGITNSPNASQLRSAAPGTTAVPAPTVASKSPASNVTSTTKVSAASNTVAATVPPPATSSVTAAPATNSTPATPGVPSATTGPATQVGANSAPASNETTAPEPVTTPSETATAADDKVAEQVPGTPIVGNLNLRTSFRVKYVADGVAYLDGGSTAGLAEGVKLVIRDPAPATGKPGESKEPVIVAQLTVVSVAQSSAVSEIHSPTRDVKPGDIAYLTSADAEALVQQRALSSTRVYPQVITFTEGDPADEEAREALPRPPLPEVNRARGRVGFEYSGITSSGNFGSSSSSEFGLVLRSDITRIGGSYWNLSGYWRGQLMSQGSTTQQTLQDLLNRTYHLSLTYDNPKSAWVAGVGRMFLPWAPSLETIDGAYFGRKVSPGVTAGIFAGSTPDPTSWSYNPNQRIGGTFVNFEGGSYEAFRYTSTSGVGVSMLNWNINRPFVFFENGLFYKRFLSIYDSLQVDHPSATPAVPSPGTGISRSYVTVRVQPIERLTLDFNHNYFRDVPTYDLALVGTGLLDKVLFQGFSVGARVEVLKNVWLYTDQGLSNRSGDTGNSKNQMYGFSWANILKSGVRADLHYSKFNSPFAQGNYQSVAISRNFRENFRWEIQAGKQAFVSPLTKDTGSRFLNMSLDTDFGTHYFIMSGVTLNRGIVQNYEQWYVTLGYRFDNRWKNTK